MSVGEIVRGGYITCSFDEYYPHGIMHNRYNTIEEAREHIKFQKEEMQSKSEWHILHVTAKCVE